MSVFEKTVYVLMYVQEESFLLLVGLSFKVKQAFIRTKSHRYRRLCSLHFTSVYGALLVVKLYFTLICQLSCNFLTVCAILFTICNFQTMMKATPTAGFLHQVKFWKVAEVN
jgi:hypothetical protein